MKILAWTLSILSIFAFLPQSVLAQSDAKRSVTEIAEDVYRLQNNFHYSLVVITGEGAVVVDPINASERTVLHRRC